MKIVILADSLALPRPESVGNITHEATYPYLLDQSLRRQWGSMAPQVIERGMRRRTIENVLDEWAEMVVFKKPEILIIHVGIVDCAPRVFRRRESRVVERLRPVWLQKLILSFAHKHRRRIVTFRQRVYVPPERFQSHVRDVCEKARADGVKSLVFINILTPPDPLEARSPGFKANVETYNRILQAAANEPWIQLLDLNGLVRSEGRATVLLGDGIHLNERGHDMLASELTRHVSGILEAATPVERTEIEV